MTIQTLNNLDSMGTQRGKINLNFQELDAQKITASSVLTKTNSTPFVPTGDYNPATKLYADNLDTAIKSTYDPTNVAGDAFDRSNHYGTLAPTVIVQDSSNRFITDAERVAWNAKEDAIGVKGTAFNKSFGTVAGSVAEGNHTHTKADIGLGNVDNTADVDKAVSTPQQAAIDLKLDKAGNDVYKLNPLAVLPTHFEGSLFYDDTHKAVSSYCEVSGVTINLGFEHLIRVWNGTGATIANGSACRQSGVDAASKQANVVLAQANNLVNAQVLGVATHDIPHNSIGYLCQLGAVHDMDTSGFAIGEVIYLSDTVPGGYTTTPPDIITVIGSSRVVSATTGVLFLSIQNSQVQPVLFGSIFDKAATMNLTTSYQTVTNYTNSNSVAMAANVTSGTITTPNDGFYRVNAAVTLTVPTSVASRSITLQIYDVTNAVGVHISSINIAKNETLVSRSISPSFEAVAGHVYSIRLLASTAISGVVFDEIDFDIQSIHVTL